MGVVWRIWIIEFDLVTFTCHCCNTTLSHPSVYQCIQVSFPYLQMHLLAGTLYSYDVAPWAI